MPNSNVWLYKNRKQIHHVELNIFEELQPLETPKIDVPFSYLNDCVTRRTKHFGNLSWKLANSHTAGYFATLSTQTGGRDLGTAVFRQMKSFVRMFVSLNHNGDTSENRKTIPRLLDGCSRLAASFGLDWPDGFEPGWFDRGFWLKLRVDKGFVSVYGEYKGTCTIMVGVPGLGWLQSPDSSVSLGNCRPGAILGLVGLSRINGKLPAEWTKEHYDRAAIKLLDCER